MPITPLPKPMPFDLKTVESLIKERVSRMDEIDAEVEAKKTEKNGIREEVVQLQDVGKRLLMITPREKKVVADKDPITGEKIK